MKYFSKVYLYFLHTLKFSLYFTNSKTFSVPSKQVLEPDSPLKPGCIRDSNKSSLKYLLIENRIPVIDVGIANDRSVSFSLKSPNILQTSKYSYKILLKLKLSVYLKSLSDYLFVNETYSTKKINNLFTCVWIPVTTVEMFNQCSKG